MVNIILQTLLSAVHTPACVLTLCCLLLMLCAHKYYYRSDILVHTASKLPGPRLYVPFIGSVSLFLEAFLTGYLDTWIRLIQRYPHPFHFWLFKRLWVIVSQPEDLEAVFMSENAVDKEPIYDFFGKTSEGIFIAKGQEWKTLRSLLNPSFHTKLLIRFLEIMVEKSEELVHVLEPELGKTINVSDHVGRCMLDIVCGSQMGVPTSELGHNNYNFAQCSAQSTELILYRMFTPHLHPQVIYKLSKVHKKMQELTRTMHRFAKMIIKERKCYLEKNQEVGCTSRSHPKEQIYLDGVLTCFADADERSLIRKVTDILIAGSDTTTVATSYAILLLGSHQEVQEKVYQEQLEVFRTASDISINTLAHMKYLDMVIKEVLRLYTIMGIVRKLKIPVTLANGVELPPGCSVYLAFYSIHRDPKYWSRPQDFYPEHFLPEHVAQRPKYSYIPFSSGPRNCPGMTFGYLSMKTVLSTVIRRYKIHADLEMKDYRHKLGLMLELQGGYPVTFTKR